MSTRDLNLQIITNLGTKMGRTCLWIILTLKSQSFCSIGKIFVQPFVVPIPWVFQPCTIWQQGLWIFQKEDTKLERFLAKNQNIQRKLLDIKFWINGKLSKSAEFDIQSQFSMSKIIRIIPNFFFIEEYDYRGTLFVFDIF